MAAINVNRYYNLTARNPSLSVDQFLSYYKAHFECSSIPKIEQLDIRSVTSRKLIDDEAEEAYSEEEEEDSEYSEFEFSDEDPEESSDESLLSDVEDTGYQPTDPPRSHQKMKLIILDSDDEVNP